MLIHKMQLPVDTLDIRKIKLPFVSAEEAKTHILKLENFLTEIIKQETS